MNHEFNVDQWIGNILMVKTPNEFLPLVQVYEKTNDGFYSEVMVSITIKDGYIIIECPPFEGVLVIR